VLTELASENKKLKILLAQSEQFSKELEISLRSAENRLIRARLRLQKVKNERGR